MATEPVVPSGRDGSGSMLARGLRIMIVDDDEQVTRSLAKALNRRGLVTAVAHDGQSALKRVQEEHFDVLVMDLRMADEDGVEVYATLGEGRPAPPAVLCSAYLDVPTTVRAVRAGFGEVLEKPVGVDALLAGIARAMDIRQKASVREGAIREAGAGLLLGESAAMTRLRGEVSRLGPYADLSVLIQGETGTGKELVARALHETSARPGAFVGVNCAAIPETLFEGELFGSEAGAYTGSRVARSGLIEEAAGGTLFLDEVAEMPPGLQSKLLRVLETRSFRRVGSNTDRSFDARIVSATNRKTSDPELRADLFYRLAGYVLHTPALREHREDVPLLVRTFANAFAARAGLSPPQIEPLALEHFRLGDFPGNVRELRSLVEQAVVRASGGPIGVELVATILESRWRASPSGTDVPSSRRAAHRGESLAPGEERDGSRDSLPEIERQLVLEAYETHGHNLSHVARALGIPRSTLRDRLRRYGVL
jgi:DNA-binding NtrC family response regulator